MSDKPKPEDGDEDLPKDTTIERRMTDGGIWSSGEDVLHDGEAESMGIPPMTKLPEHRITRPAEDEDIDQDIPDAE